MCRCHSSLAAPITRGLLPGDWSRGTRWKAFELPSFLHLCGLVAPAYFAARCRPDFSDAKTITQMIDRDKNLTQDQKLRQRDAIGQVLRFCMNQTDCRRSQVLSFFNEDFDPVKCQNGCDVCLSRDQKTYAVEDVTHDAVSVLKMIQNLQRDDRITVVSAAEIWRGVNRAAAQKFAGNPYFGAGGEWERGEAERLIQWMLTEKALGEFTVRNAAGWSNSYLKVSFPMVSLSMNAV